MALLARATLALIGLIVVGIVVYRYARAGLFRVPDAAGAGNVFAEACRRYELTAREQDIARLIAAGLSNQQIADDLGVTVSTVKKHITKVYRKCAAASRDDMLAKFR